jgi:CubicO group peptidase (beta-lactamase class C family)
VFKVRSLLVILSIAVGSSAVAAESSCVAEPESVGMSSARLQRLQAAMQQYVDDGKAAGIVTYVARAGRIVNVQGFGMSDIEAGHAMTTDTLFRIASQTKLITSVAVMMLVEEGRIALEDPLSRYLPAFGKSQVAVAADGDRPPRLVPAKRAITIRDLLTHTSGVSYGTGISASYWKQAGIQGGYYADRDEPMAALVERMATLPLDAQPGERFVYGHSIDILGVVVEKISGLTLGQFLRSRLFDPLQMHDTHFFVPPDQAHRLAAVYAAEPAGLRRANGPDGLDSQGHFVVGPRVTESGGGGIVTTARDYGRFLQMLLNEGQLDGVRVLGPRTVELMTVNHIGSLFADQPAHRPGLGFGLGVAVMFDQGAAATYGSVGSYGFAGAYFTAFWVDPKDQLISMVLTQLRPPLDTTLQSRFRALVYQSIVAPPPTGAVACNPSH